MSDQGSLRHFDLAIFLAESGSDGGGADCCHTASDVKASVAGRSLLGLEAFGGKKDRAIICWHDRRFERLDNLKHEAAT